MAAVMARVGDQVRDQNPSLDTQSLHNVSATLTERISGIVSPFFTYGLCELIMPDDVHDGSIRTKFAHAADARPS